MTVDNTILHTTGDSSPNGQIIYPFMETQGLSVEDDTLIDFMNENNLDNINDLVQYITRRTTQATGNNCNKDDDDNPLGTYFKHLTSMGIYTGIVLVLFTFLKGVVKFGVMILLIVIGALYFNLISL
jgi:hypothetical protein